MGIYELYKKWTPDERKQAMAGMNALRFLELRSEMLRAGCTAPQMLRAGFTAPQMLDAGFTADSLAEMESEPQKDIQKKAAKMGRIESEYVVEILEKGLMDGSKYGTLESCGCFIGSAAKRAGETAEEYCRKRGIEKSSGSPAERWFMSVLVGDTPENNYAAKRGVEWIKEAIAGMAV